MGKLIRRTVTITIHETWTIVWLPDDIPLDHPPTAGQAQANAEEQPDEALQAPLITAGPGNPGAGPPPVTPLTPAAAPDPQPGGAPARSTAGNKRKRARGRRAQS
jgi:hypothetical protein